MSTHREPFEPQASRYLVEQGYRPGILTASRSPSASPTISMGSTAPALKGYATLAALKNRDLFGALSKHKAGSVKEAPLLQLPGDHGSRGGVWRQSSFCFLALALRDQDYSYDIRDFEEEIGMIADAGWEVGLHGVTIPTRPGSPHGREAAAGGGPGAAGRRLPEPLPPVQSRRPGSTSAAPGSSRYHLRVC